MSTCPNWTVAPVIAGLVGNLSAKINRLKEYIITNQQHPQYGSSLRRFLFGSCGIKKSVIHASVCLSVYLKRVYLCGKFIGHLRTTYLRNSYITPQARISKAFAGFICTYASPFYKPVTPCVSNPAERDLFASVLCVSRPKTVIRSICGVTKPSPKRVLFGGITKPA